MSRREGLRLLAAGVLTVWLCLFLHWENTEKSMIRSLLVETKDDSWTVGLLYQFPEASADSSEAEAAIRLCVGRGPQLSAAIAAAEKALPQRADWRLCEYLFVEQDSVRRALPVCEELFLHQPCGRLASRMFGAGFSVETLEERAGASDVLPENLLQCVKNSAPSAPRLYEQGSGFVLPIVELEEEGAHCRPEALVVTPEQTATADRSAGRDGAATAGQEPDDCRGAPLYAGRGDAPPAPGFLRRGAGRGGFSSPGECSRPR